MSKLYDYLLDKYGLGVHDESDMDIIRDIVLEETGFKWIPGLPEKEGWYLASYKENGIVDVDCIYFPTNFEVVAWMPLPKPYEP